MVFGTAGTWFGRATFSGEWKFVILGLTTLAILHIYWFIVSVISLDKFIRFFEESDFIQSFSN